MPADNQKKHDAILEEAKRFREKCITVNAENRRLAVDDLTFLSGKHWDSRDAALREKEGRPVLTIDKLSTFVRQIKNDQRINKPSIKVHPVDDESDPETAKVRQGMIRYIEYSSNASIAYDTAIGCASETGLGYFRIITDYESEDSFDVVPRFVRIRNPLTVHFDPDSIEGDGSDARKVLVEERLGVTEFCSKYPESEIAKTRKTTGNAARDDMDDILVAEYIRVEDDPDELILLSNGEKGWKSDLLALPPDLTIVNTRKSARRTVRNYKIAGKCVGDDGADFGEVIEEADVPCKWIPVFPVYGNEIDIEGKVIRSGVIRGAKDPSRMYDYWMTSATEEYALRTKTPFIGAEGQFEGYEAQWAQANRRSFAYLQYKPKTVGGQLAPPPARQPMADVPVGAITMAMHASDDIKATTGMFDAALGARGTATSGIQEREQKRQGGVANFHYTDNLNRAVLQAGRCLLDMIPRLFDTERVARIMGEDETITSAPINKRLEQPEIDEKTGKLKTTINDMSVGQYDCTVSAGPSFSTLRQEASEAMVSFGQSWPKLMDIAGDKVVRAMDWPGAEEIAERIAKTIPPELLEDEDKPEQQQIPPEVMQIMQQAQSHIQELEAALQEASQGIEKERIKAASAENVARINATSRQDVEELKGWIAMLTQQMQPPPALAGAAMATGQQDPGLVPQMEK
jgi:hypothetical protein